MPTSAIEACTIALCNKDGGRSQRERPYYFTDSGLVYGIKNTIAALWAAIVFVFVKLSLALLPDLATGDDEDV